MHKKRLTYCFDLDNTLCATIGKNYEESVPMVSAINKLNDLKKGGHKIIIYTARGASSGKDWYKTTFEQLDKWGIQYDKLMVGNKPTCDVFVDDKAINAREWRTEQDRGVTGFVAGAFDLFHAGHCLLLKEAKEVCDYLYIGLQRDPTIEHYSNRCLKQPKNRPIQGVQERVIQLESCKYVDEIIPYDIESDLYSILDLIRPDIRIIGSDYRGVGNITGEEFSHGVVYHDRQKHRWSTSGLRERVLNDSRENAS